jgi:hypothetical protein
MAELNSRSAAPLAGAPTAGLRSGALAADTLLVDARATDRLELRLGVALPPSYRRHLLGPDGPAEDAAIIWSYDGGPPRDRPGELRFALATGHDGAGRRVLLDPLDTGRDGEWAAWALEGDGATWHRSFAALRAGDTGDPDDPDTLPAEAVDDPGALELLARATAPPETHAAALRRLVRLGAGDRVRDLLGRDAADRALPAGRRVLALRWLGGAGDPGDVPLLVAAAGDPRSVVRAAALPWLACSDVARAQQAAVELLVRPDVEGILIRAARGPAAWALADAWNLTRDPRLLVGLAASGDARAVAGLVEAVPDPRTPASVRAGLVRYAASPGDRSVVAALIGAAGMPGAPATAVAAALHRLEPPVLRGGGRVPAQSSDAFWDRASPAGSGDGPGPD